MGVTAVDHPQRRSDRWAIAALVWAVLVGGLLAVLPLGETSTTTTSGSGTGSTTTSSESLLASEGAGVLLVLAVPALLALIAVVVPRRDVRMGLGGLATVACVVAVLSVGAFFLPAAGLLLAAAASTPARRVDR